MTAVLVTDIGQLVTCSPELGDESPLGVLQDAAVVLEEVPAAGASAYRMI